MPINRGRAPKPVRPTPAPRDQPDPAPAAPGCTVPATMATPRSPRAHPSCPGGQDSPPAGPGLQRPGRCGRAGAPGSGLARRSGARQRRRRQEEQEEEKEEKRGSKGGARPLRREPAGFAEPPGAASRRCAGQPPGAPSGRGCRGGRSRCGGAGLQHKAGDSGTSLGGAPHAEWGGGRLLGCSGGRRTSLGRARGEGVPGCPQAGGSGRSLPARWSLGERSESKVRADFGKRVPKKEPGAEQHDSATRTESPLISALNKKWMKEWVSGDQSSSYVVMLATDAISSMGTLFAFICLDLPRSVRRSHMTWMHFCIPGCPLIWEYYLFFFNRKVRYVRGVDLHSHFFMASFILAFMF